MQISSWVKSVQACVPWSVPRIIILRSSLSFEFSQLDQERKELFYQIRDVPDSVKFNSSDKIIIFKFFYEELSYLKTSQIPKTTIADLLSLIGGALGCFLGVNLLSFIEVLDFFIELLF